MVVLQNHYNTIAGTVKCKLQHKFAKNKHFS